ncbi:MAG: T9SS type A sorting domain-containing protein, partial [Crocinitomicaceae bacterium]
DDGSCLYPGVLCDDNNPNTINDSINPDCNCVGDLIVLGCTDPLSCNFNPLANQNDGSCIYPDTPCDDNNPDTMNDTYDSTCNCVGILMVPGCMDPFACNFNPLANVDDSSCVYPGDTCDDGDSTTINDVYTASCDCAGQTNGIQELASIASIYPNPSSDVVTIEFTGMIEGAVMYLCDVQGRILLTKVLETNKVLLSVNSFETGTYFLSINGSKNAIVKQIIIE